MRIVDEREKCKRFSRIFVGSVFQVETGEVYMKITDSADITTTEEFNAIELIDGAPRWFAGDEEVELLDVELVIK